MAKKNKITNTELAIGGLALAAIGVFAYLKIRGLGKKVNFIVDSVRITNFKLNSIDGALYLKVTNVSNMNLTVKAISGTVSYKDSTVFTLNNLEEFTLQGRTTSLVKVPFQTTAIQLGMNSLTLLNELRAGNSKITVVTQGVAVTNYGTIPFDSTKDLEFGALGRVLAKKQNAKQVAKGKQVRAK